MWNGVLEDDTFRALLLKSREVPPLIMSSLWYMIRTFACYFGIFRLGGLFLCMRAGGRIAVAELRCRMVVRKLRLGDR